MTTTDLFHPGELYFQTKIGVSRQVASLAPRLILDNLSRPHREFYSQLNMLLVGSVDNEGQPWASLLSGKPGFINIIDEKLVRINATPVTGDPLINNLKPESHLGLLGLDFSTRRRNRLSAQVKYKSNEEILIMINKSFGNCPKYIQTRNINLGNVNNNTEVRNKIKRVDKLDDTIKQLISTADTFFIASYYPQLEHRGADVSHRGGKPGFVRIENDSELVIDDYAGNNLFMTLGNLHSNPIAGLLFIDFKAGDILQLACASEIINTPNKRHPRQIRFTLKYGWFNESRLPITSKFLEYSPFL